MNTQSGMFLKKFSINAGDNDVEEVVTALGGDLEKVAAVVHTQADNKEQDHVQDKRLPAEENSKAEEQEAYAPWLPRLFHRKEDLEEGDVQKRFLQTIKSPVRER